MLERAFVFEIAADRRHEIVGAGALCVARREVTIWKAGEGVFAGLELSDDAWIRLERELASSLPTGRLARTSAICQTLTIPFNAGAVSVQYLGVFPMDAIEWLPAHHPATAVLAAWQTTAFAQSR